MPQSDADQDEIELLRIRERRIAQLKKEALLESELYGSLTSVSQEKEAVHIVAHTAKLVIHFRMPAFRRCAIMSDHLAILTKAHPKTRFIEVNAEDMPFLVAKWKIQVLPCLVVILMGQVVGFDELGGSDNFPTTILAKRLQLSGAILPLAKDNERHCSDSEDE